MAHFAELDANNVILRVLVVHNSLEHRGAEFLANDLGLGGRWIQTSYSGTIRKNFAGIGFTYDESRDAFIAPKPFESWLLDEQTCKWVAPKPYPNDGNFYSWDESKGNWVDA
jgi:hypothetical protein